jgi:hypothetical protein
VKIEAANDWQARVLEDTEGDSEARVIYFCPSCGMRNELNVQTSAWEAPVVAEDEDATGQVDHFTSSISTEVGKWEAKRARDEVEHETTDTMPTQLWCHRCQKGTDAVLTR